MALPVIVYELVRDGEIRADVVVFPDGLTVCHWRPAPSSTEFYKNEAEFRSVRIKHGNYLRGRHR